MKDNTKFYPKGLFEVRIDGCNYIVKSTQEKLEDYVQRDLITEYRPLVAYRLN